MALPEERVITHVSNFRPVKCIGDVIEIFYRIQKELPAKLIMVGEGPERKEAEQLCKNIAIIDKGSLVENTTLKDLLKNLHHQTFIFDVSESIGILPDLTPFSAEKIDANTIELKVEKKTAAKWQEAYDNWIIAQKEIAKDSGLGRIF